MIPSIFEIFDENEAARLYASGESIRTIAKILHMERPRVSRLVKERGIIVNERAGGGRPFEYQVNHQAFDEITDEAAYWVGFLMADGCVSELGQIVVTLSRKDRPHLEKLSKFLGSERPLYETKSTGYSATPNGVTLSLRSKPLCKALAKFGVVPAKTFTAEAPETIRNNAHFWRGVVDGDGCISPPSGKSSVELVGSEKVCNQFADFVLSLSCKRPTVEIHKSIFRVRVAKKVGLKLLTALNYEHSTTSLDRKRDRALQHLYHRK
jgi:hypothetical protein